MSQSSDPITEVPSRLIIKPLRNQFLRLIIFGTPKLLPRLISFCSSASALPQANTAMLTLLQKLSCLAERHALRGH